MTGFEVVVMVVVVFVVVATFVEAGNVVVSGSLGVVVVDGAAVDVLVWEGLLELVLVAETVLIRVEMFSLTIDPADCDFCVCGTNIVVNSEAILADKTSGSSTTDMAERTPMMLGQLSQQKPTKK